MHSADKPMSYIEHVDTLVSLMLFGVMGLSFAFLCLAVNKNVLNALLIMSPAFITALYGPLTGQSTGSLALNGSVLDRIKYMLIFGAPFFIGFLGVLNRQKLEGKRERENVSISSQFFIGIVVVVALLKIFSIVGLKPVAGQGQSIYVPIFASALSIFSILIMAGPLISLRDVRKATEFILCALYFFLLLNCFTHLATWAPQQEIFQSTQTDGFRFSPFEQILQLSGRQAFFDSDPESFAVFSLFAFTVLLTSESKIYRIIGPIIIFIVGSTTQSRLFYIVTLLVFFLNIFLYRENQFTKLSKRGFYLLIFFTYYYLLVLNTRGHNESGITNFSGRTNIWMIVLQHWNDRGSVLGHQGIYSLEDYSSENTGRLVFFNAHNLVLQFLWDWGLIGFLIVSVFFICTFFMAGKLIKSGYILATVVIFAGIIEITLANSLLYSKFAFILLLVKYASSGKEGEKAVKAAF